MRVCLRIGVGDIETIGLVLLARSCNCNGCLKAPYSISVANRLVSVNVDTCRQAVDVRAAHVVHMGSAHFLGYGKTSCRQGHTSTAALKYAGLPLFHHGAKVGPAIAPRHRNDPSSEAFATCLDPVTRLRLANGKNSSSNGNFEDMLSKEVLKVPTSVTQVVFQGTIDRLLAVSSRQQGYNPQPSDIWDPHIAFNLSYHHGD